MFWFMIYLQRLTTPSYFHLPSAVGIRAMFTVLVNPSGENVENVELSVIIYACCQPIAVRLSFELHHKVTWARGSHECKQKWRAAMRRLFS